MYPIVATIVNCYDNTYTILGLSILIMNRLICIYILFGLTSGRKPSLFSGNPFHDLQIRSLCVSMLLSFANDENNGKKQISNRDLIPSFSHNTKNTFLYADPLNLQSNNLS